MAAPRYVFCGHYLRMLQLLDEILFLAQKKNEIKKSSYLQMINIINKVNETCIYLFNFNFLEECMFGDDPYTFRYGYRTIKCKGGYYSVQHSPDLCYFGEIRRQCCNTCSSFYTGLLGKYLVNFHHFIYKAVGRTLYYCQHFTFIYFKNPPNFLIWFYILQNRVNHQMINYFIHLQFYLFILFHKGCED